MERTPGGKESPRRWFFYELCGFLSSEVLCDPGKRILRVGDAVNQERVRAVSSLGFIDLVDVSHGAERFDLALTVEHDSLLVVP
jgi:hypothetical protein